MTQYYCDPATGNDGNNGTAQVTPWKTIPGTRNTANSAFLNAAWGTITTSNKLSAGDIVNIKAGSAFSSATGGKWLIDSNYYNNGTAGNLVTVQISSTWGSGDVTVSAAGVTIDAFHGFIDSISRSYIRIAGADATKMFRVTGTSGKSGFLCYGGTAHGTTGNRYDWCSSTGCTGAFGFEFDFTDNLAVSNCLGFNNTGSGAIGFAIGGAADARCDNAVFTDCEAYGNGTGFTGQPLAFGFQYVGCSGGRFLRCTSHDNGRDGFDNGTTSNTANVDATYVNCSSYSNGEDGWGANGGPSGTQTFILINCISHNNAHGGQWYERVNVEAYNCVLADNAGGGIGGNILTYTADAATPANIKLRNCILYKPKGGWQIGEYDQAAKPTNFDVDYCLFIPRAADSEQFIEHPWGTSFNYTSPPSYITGPGHNKYGISFATPTLFTAYSGTVFSSCDFHLPTDTTAAKNAGTLSGLPADALVDKDNVTRSSPPEIGPYEFGTPSLPDNETFNWDTQWNVDALEALEMAESDAAGPLPDDIFQIIYIPVYTEM